MSRELSEALAAAAHQRLFSANAVWPRRTVEKAHFRAEVVIRSDLGEVHFHLTIPPKTVPAPRTPREKVEQEAAAAARHLRIQEYLAEAVEQFAGSTAGWKRGWFPEVKIWGICNQTWLANPLVNIDTQADRFLDHVDHGIRGVL